MNKKYLMKGLTALALIVGFTSCVKDVEGITPAEEAEKEKENAEINLGLKIPEGQTWEMAEQVTANVNVSKKAGETYRVTVYSNNPLADGKGIFLTRGTINNGETFKGKFTCPSGVNSLYVGLTDSKGYTVYKQAKVENGRLDLTFGGANNSARSMRAPYTVGGDTHDYFDLPSQEELAAAFPSIPTTNIASNSALNDYNQLINLIYIDGQPHNKGPRPELTNFILTSAGEYTVGGGLQNTRWIAVEGHPNGGYQQPDPVNIFVNVGANETVTFKRQGNFQFNLYVISGKVELDSEFGEMGTLFSVASGATLVDNRTTFSDNGSVKLYNRGTVRTGSAYSIGNNALVYNEGKFYVNGALDYIAGSWRDPRFFNIGDVRLAAGHSCTCRLALGLQSLNFVHQLVDVLLLTVALAPDDPPRGSGKQQQQGDGNDAVACAGVAHLLILHRQLVVAKLGIEACQCLGRLAGVERVLEEIETV